MIVTRVKGRYIFISLVVLMILSTYINLTWAGNTLPEYSEFIVTHKTSLFIILVVFQLFTLLVVLLLEMLILFFIVRIALKKETYIRNFLKPVLIGTLVANVLNVTVAFFYLSSVQDVNSIYQLVLSSPVNYALKPLIICYLLFKQDLISKNILDWIIVGGIYVIVLYIPNFILITFL
ncbi:hypothetical protein SAMN05216238_107126 [Lentibacillus persicus]|uniref:Yip1 domain-containing protein n=1 Tax=Lentibacillus persicus TaxID=640948 RepID=A0A1I1X721_9BACI|nr:hypothetical protein [Lentibacillus persicus]SFE03011.1 hypothetical protein SAMN05216238_107126 [Lentibacillus persicus]